MAADHQALVLAEVAVDCLALALVGQGGLFKVDLGPDVVVDLSSLQEGFLQEQEV